MQTLAALNTHYRNPYAVSLVYLLGWLAASDGSVADDERIFLRELCRTFFNDPGAADSFLVITREPATTDIVTACRQLKAAVTPGSAHLVLEMTLAMSMADGVFSVSENHVIRFLADALGINQRQFSISFQLVTGRAPQDPSDLSRATWWDERDCLRKEKRDRDRAQREQEKYRSSQRDRSSSQGRTGSSTTPPPMSGSRRSEALKHLGLGPEATMVEIKEAYKRLAKVHHPDRFEGLSVEIIEAASLSFRRIRTAYEDLTS